MLSERSALLALYLKRRQRDPAAFDLSALATATEGFSGAEIEEVIGAGLYTAFDRKQQLTNEILLAEIEGTQPLSVTRAEEVQGDKRVGAIASGASGLTAMRRLSRLTLFRIAQQ